MDYSFQDKLKEQIKQAFKEGHRKVVLAAAPGAGKTRMALELAEELGSRTLILAHGQSLLREQWADRTKHLSRQVLRSGFDKRLLKKAKVVVTIPQTINNKLDGNKFDLLVVDEAHERYLADQVQNIRDTIKPKLELLLTGTPHHFIKKDEYKIIGITSQELLQHGVIKDPKIKLVESPYILSFRDYNEQLVVRQGKTFSKEDTQKTIQSCLDELNTNNKKIGKTLIACHNQLQAMDTHAYLESKGLTSILNISSLSDGTEELLRFTTGKDQFMVVVFRGILGFDYLKLENVIDASATMNPFRIFQMLSRVVRNSGQEKRFLKVTDKDLAVAHYVMMNLAVALSHKKYYYEVFSKRGTEVPVPQKPNRHNFSIADAQIFTFNEVSRPEVLAKTTFHKVKRKIESRAGRMDMMEITNIAKLCSGRLDFQEKHRSIYEYLRKCGMLSILDPIFGAYKFTSWKSMTDEELISKANEIQEEKKYRSFHVFRLSNSALSKELRRRKLLDKFNLKVTKKKWTEETAIASITKFLSAAEAERNGLSGATAFLRTSCGYRSLNKFFPGSVYKRISLQRVKRLVQKYKTLRKIRDKSWGAYTFLRNNPEVAKKLGIKTRPMTGRHANANKL